MLVPGHAKPDADSPAGGSRAGLLGPHFLVPLSDAAWTGLVSPLLTDPPLRAKQWICEAAFPCLRQLSEDWGLCVRNPCEEGEAVVPSNAGRFSELGKVGFFILFSLARLLTLREKNSF